MTLRNNLLFLTLAFLTCLVALPNLPTTKADDKPRPIVHEEEPLTNYEKAQQKDLARPIAQWELRSKS